MNTQPLFSIIIPVYNVEQYVERCINSVLSQNFADYELILVNDGSLDNSGKICDSYGDNSHVIVIHKENGGSSSARNAGLDIAKGRYVLFIDSDDYWGNKEALGLLSTHIALHPADDVILYGCRNTYLSTGYQEVRHDNYNLSLMEVGEKRDVLQQLYKTRHYPGASWIMCTANSLISSLKLRFPIGVVAEDLDWINVLLAQCNHIGAVNAIIYEYQIGRIGQLTGKPSINSINGMVRAITNCIDNVKIRGYHGICLQMAHVYLVMLMMFSELSNVEKKAVKAKVTECSEILTYGNWKHRFIKTTIRITRLSFLGLIIRYGFLLKNRIRRA